MGEDGLCHLLYYENKKLSILHVYSILSLSLHTLPCKFPLPSLQLPQIHLSVLVVQLLLSKTKVSLGVRPSAIWAQITQCAGI